MTNSLPKRWFQVITHDGRIIEGDQIAAVDFGKFLYTQAGVLEPVVYLRGGEYLTLGETNAIQGFSEKPPDGTQVRPDPPKAKRGRARSKDP